MEQPNSPRQQLLAKVTELGGRYGLNPGDFAVVIRSGFGEFGMFAIGTWPRSQLALAFPVGPTGSAKEVRFKAMLESLSIPAETGELVGDYISLCDALDLALRVVPPQ